MGILKEERHIVGYCCYFLLNVARARAKFGQRPENDFREKNMKKIAVANVKGGVGKTVTTICLIDILGDAGKKMLVVQNERQFGRPLKKLRAIGGVIDSL